MYTGRRFAFENLKRLTETSSSGYRASHPPSALSENLESRRYRELWFPDTQFFLLFNSVIIIYRAPPFSSKTRALRLTKLYKIRTFSTMVLEEKNLNCALGPICLLRHWRTNKNQRKRRNYKTFLTLHAVNFAPWLIIDRDWVPHLLECSHRAIWSG